jgi:hypothetical protein
MKTTAKLSPADLRQFTGTENYYRHALNPKILFTDGAKYVADRVALTGSSISSHSRNATKSACRVNRFRSGRSRAWNLQISGELTFLIQNMRILAEL